MRGELEVSQKDIVCHKSFMSEHEKPSLQKKAIEALDKMASGDWRCGGCEAMHNGLPDLCTTYPDAAGVPKVPELNSALRMDESFLSEDFCILDGKYFFIRTVLMFPIKNYDHEFGFGVWSSLSKDNFEIYVENFDVGFDDGVDLNWTSWFMTNLNYFGQTFSAKSWVKPQANRQRPIVFFADEEHPIYQLQTDGIEPMELLKIYDYYGCRLAE